jgi:sulfur transfer complex TusBCD TusB component (DsrH family)
MAADLYILKQADAPDALELVAQASRADSALVLIQDAVRLRPQFAGNVYVLRDDARHRGVQAPYPEINYEQLLQMVFEADRVKVC